MTTIVTRAGKGSPLTHTEVDTNFTNLNTAKLETAAIPLGTLGAPSISFLSYSTTGIYSPAGDELGVSMLGSDKIRIKSTGEIIINATASRTTLSTTPRLQIEGSASSNQCSMSLTGAGAGGTLFPRLHLSKARSSVNAIVLQDDILGFISFNGGDGSSLVNAGFIKAEVDGTPSAGIVPGRLVFATVDTAGGSGERMIIKNNGNVSIDGTTFNVDAVNNRVGIGTTSPASLLHVAAALPEVQIIGSTNAYLTIRGASGGPWTWRSNSTSLSVEDNGNERLRIDGSGRLLVGTSTAITNLEPFTTPSHQFVGNDSTTGGGMLVLGKTASSSLYLSRGQSGDAVSLGANGLIGGLRFTGYDGAQYSRFAHIICEADAAVSSNISPGRLVFATTPDGVSSPTERMRIDNDGNGIWGDTSTNPTNGHVLNRNGGNGFYTQTGHPNGTGTGVAYARFMYNQGEIGSIAQNGTTAVSYNTSSDYRLKENVVPVADGITRLLQLKPSRFNFIVDPGHTVDGFIAHEAQSVVPECVTGEKDAVDDDGNPVYQGIDQSKLVPLLTAALQEAVAEIKALKDRVTALEAA